MEDKRRTISLISVTHTQDGIGQIIETETAVEVVADLRSVSLNEWTNAGQLGLSAQYQAVIWAFEYHGEDTVDIGEKRYKVYRTYETGRRIELYLEEMVGHVSPGDDEEPGE